MNVSVSSPNAVASIGLADEERQRCEVWTRVMGYHRPVASFNQGKKGEFYERVSFREPGCADNRRVCASVEL